MVSVKFTAVNFFLLPLPRDELRTLFAYRPAFLDIIRGLALRVLEGFQIEWRAKKLLLSACLVAVWKLGDGNFF